MIVRDPDAASADRFDMIVIGGGIYGVALTLEASRRGLRTLILEQKDFGHATSWNSLRIVHGGLRYLQSLDLPRFRESVRARSWFLRTFPDLVRPLPCLMPLYSKGLRRNSVLAVALRTSDFLSRHRNRGVPEDLQLPDGRVVPPAETAILFPAVERQGLNGAALWYDAAMPSSSRVIVEMLRWACGLGATALNYITGENVLVRQHSIAGVRAKDELSGTHLEFRAPVVVNCAGPWSRELARAFDRDLERLFRPSLALNVLFDCEPGFSVGVGVRPRTTGGRTYFMYPWRRQVLAGTHHAAWNGGPAEPGPPEREIEALIAGLRNAVPEMGFRREQVRHVFWGLLPAAVAGTARLAVREVLYNHGAHGGPEGLYSVSGVKFTTAPLVAQKTLKMIFPERAWSDDTGGVGRPATTSLPTWEGFCRLAARDAPSARALLEKLMREEAAVRLEDIVLRRAGWAITPDECASVCRRLEGLKGGDPLPASED